MLATKTSWGWNSHCVICGRWIRVLEFSAKFAWSHIFFTMVIITIITGNWTTFDKQIFWNIRININWRHSICMLKSIDPSMFQINWYNILTFINDTFAGWNLHIYYNSRYVKTNGIRFTAFFVKSFCTFWYDSKVSNHPNHFVLISKNFWSTKAALILRNWLPCFINVCIFFVFDIFFFFLRYLFADYFILHCFIYKIICWYSSEWHNWFHCCCRAHSCQRVFSVILPYVI